MKRSIIAAGALAVGLLGFNIVSASAGQYNVTGTVMQANPVYQTVTQQVPQQSCQMVQVPVYGATGNGGTLGLNNHIDIGSAIIGGIIGNNVTKNVDNGGAIGAVIGGLIGSQNQQKNNIVGYRQEQRCNTTYSSQQSQRFSHTDIVVEVEGMQVQARTTREVAVGDQVNVLMTLQVQ